MSYVVRPHDDAWTIVLNLKNQIYKERIQLRERSKVMQRVLYTTLAVLEKHDIPVKAVYWESYCRCIDLKEDVALTKEAANEIASALGMVFTSDLDSGRLHTNFRVAGGSYSHSFYIESGKNSCRLRKITEEVIVPERREERISYILDGDCSTFNELNGEAHDG